MHKRRAFALVSFFILDACLLGISAARHVFWRDEAQAWLLARDSSSLPALIQNLRYEGHPPLWHFLLFLITRLSTNPQWMKVPHLLLALAIAGLLFSAGRLPTSIRVLAPFSYFLLFEYGVVVRGYALGIALVLSAALALAERSRGWPWLVPLLLALASCSSLPAAITAAALFAVYLTCMPHPMVWKAWLSCGLFLACLGLSCCLIRPPADTGVFLRPHDPLTLPSTLLLSGFLLVQAYLPVPQIAPALWDHTLWNSANPSFTILTGFALLIGMLVVLRGWRPRLFLLTATCALLAELLAARRYSMRHTGWLFIALLVALVLEDRRPAVRNQAGLVVRPLLLLLVFVASAYGGLLAFAMSMAHPFSASRATIALLKTGTLAKSPLVFEPDYLGAAVLAGLPGSSAYSLELRRPASFAIWNRDEFLNRHLPTQAEWARVSEQLGAPVLVTDAPLPSSLAEQLRLERIGGFTEALCGDSFFVYRSRTPPLGQPPEDSSQHGPARLAPQ